MLPEVNPGEFQSDGRHIQPAVMAQRRVDSIQPVLAGFVLGVWWVASRLSSLTPGGHLCKEVRYRNRSLIDIFLRIKDNPCNANGDRMAEISETLNQESIARAWNRVVVAVSIAFAIAAISIVFVVPSGEAPDEPAHIEYIDSLLINSELPHDQSDAVIHGYESHQPPLYYATTAGLFRLLGIRAIDLQFVADQDFHFAGDGRPAFLKRPGTESESAEKRVTLARTTSVLYGLVFVFSMFFLLSAATNNAPQGFVAGTIFCLSPQIVFSSGTVNNDIGLAAFGTLVIASIAKGLSFPLERTFWLFIGSVSAGLAVWMKASGAAYLPAVFIVALMEVLRRNWRSVFAAVVPCSALVIAGMYSNFMRFGSLFPQLPTGWDSEGKTSIGRLFDEPWWIVSTWGSFWAKFGWFNLPLPKATYLWFLLPSASIIVGVLAMAHQSRTNRKLLALLLTIVVTNLLLFTVYLTQVDWQPQGRYLFPSIGAFSVFCAIGLKSMTRIVPERLRVSTTVAVCFSAGAVCFYSIWFIWQNYMKWSTIM